MSSSFQSNAVIATDDVVQLASLRAAHTSMLLQRLRHSYLQPQVMNEYSNRSLVTSVWKAIVECFTQDEKREQPMLDLMQSCEDGSNALIHLIDAVNKCTPHGHSSTAFMPYVSKLLKGASLEMRDAEGRTPLIRWASSANASIDLEILLTNGADINAQDNEGRTMMHWLVENQNLVVIQKLAVDGWLARVDYTLLNKAGETMLHVAHRKKNGQRFGTGVDIAEYIFSQVEVWRTVIRPAMSSALAVTLIPDVASMVMQYVDGSDEFKDGSSSSK